MRSKRASRFDRIVRILAGTSVRIGPLHAGNSALAGGSAVAFSRHRRSSWRGVEMDYSLSSGTAHKSQSAI